MSIWKTISQAPQMYPLIKKGLQGAGDYFSNMFKEQDVPALADDIAGVPGAFTGDLAGLDKVNNFGSVPTLGVPGGAAAAAAKGATEGLKETAQEIPSGAASAASSGMENLLQTATGMGKLFFTGLNVMKKEDERQKLAEKIMRLKQLYGTRY